MSGNTITRREFNISRMKKEFPDKPIDLISNAQWELELEYPETDWEQKVYYDTGKPVNKSGTTKQIMKNTPPMPNKMPRRRS